MTYEELISSMVTAAYQNNQRILVQAAHEAEEILHEAKERAAKITESFLAEKKQAALAERVRVTYLTRQEGKTAVSAVKHELYDLAFEIAGEELAGIRNLGSYPALFRRLLIEAMQESGEENPVFHIDNRDITLCNTTLEQMQITGQIIADITCSGGLLVSSTDGRIVAMNTLESRLERAKDLYRVDIYSKFAGV